MATQDEESAITVFDRGADGQLTYSGCFANQGTYGCESPPHDSLRDLGGVAISADGKSVYSSAESIRTRNELRPRRGSRAHLRRLHREQLLRHGTCSRLHAYEAPVARRSGRRCREPRRQVGLRRLSGEPVLNRFDRDSDGHLTYQGCIANGGARGCARSPIGSLAGDDALALSPDGRSLYTASFDNAAITRFDRSSDGAIHWCDCFSSRDYEVARGCRRAPSGSLEAGVSIAVSQDGRRVYYGG